MTEANVQEEEPPWEGSTELFMVVNKNGAGSERYGDHLPNSGSTHSSD
jgi:hypothetical protein